jgi:hypothetical protein
LWGGKKNNKIKHETRREKRKEKEFYLGDSSKREITRFGFCTFAYKCFVKHINQGEFVRFGLMVQSKKMKETTYVCERAKKSKEFFFSHSP